MCYILCQNVFEFQTGLYRQIKGCVMGTSLAPFYANLYMDLNEQENMYNITILKENVLLYCRFIIIFSYGEAIN